MNKGIGKALLWIILCLPVPVAGQSPLNTPDTLQLTLDSAQHLFVNNNLALLAQRYSVDVQKALIQQAKLYSNPNLSLGMGVYNTVTHKFFATGMGTAGGEVTAQLSQMIILAGKRNKQVKLAEAGTRLTEEQLYDLLRTLKYTLRTDFFSIYYLKQSARVYSQEIDGLKKVTGALDEQRGKGYIAEKEVLRVKAQLYSLLAEYNDLLNQIRDTESELRLILQLKPEVFIDPVISVEKEQMTDPLLFQYTALLDSAHLNRSDLRIARVNSDISRLNYQYQKSLAVPDITLSVGYDQQGSYINNFNFLGVAIDLPFFNRNQGNIKSASVGVKASETAQKVTEATVEENVYRALQKAVEADRLYKSVEKTFVTEFEKLVHEVLLNYQKRNLGLLEFMDYYDAYKQNVLQMNGIRYNRMQALEDINFYTGTNFFN